MIKTLYPDTENLALTSTVNGQNQYGENTDLAVVIERPITLFLNGQEIVTNMTIGDYPKYLAVGYLLNQNMLLPDDVITAIDYEDDLGVVVVRTERKTNFEEKLKKKTRTSGCAQGTVFGDVMEKFDTVNLASSVKIKASDIRVFTKAINTMDSLYLKAGAIHGCVLINKTEPIIYMEDVGRHNAIDKIAGYVFMNKIKTDDMVFYTTGRLTSEMVIKCVQMGISILVSRSGFTEWGVDLARKSGLTLIGRARGERFTVLSGQERVIFDLEKKKKDSHA